MPWLSSPAPRWWVLCRFVLLHVGTSLTVVPVTSAQGRPRRRATPQLRRSPDP